VPSDPAKDAAALELDAQEYPDERGEILLEKISARETIAFFCLCNVVLLTWGVLSPAIRRAPSLNDLATAEG